MYVVVYVPADRASCRPCSRACTPSRALHDEERVCVSVSRKRSNDTNNTATAPSQASRRTVRGRQQLGQALAGRAHERGAKAELLTVELLLTRLVLLLLLLLICQYTHGHQQYHHEQCKIREQRSTISMHCRSASERANGWKRAASSRLMPRVGSDRIALLRDNAIARYTGTSCQPSLLLRRHRCRSPSISPSLALSLSRCPAVGHAVAAAVARAVVVARVVVVGRIVARRVAAVVDRRTVARALGRARAVVRLRARAAPRLRALRDTIGDTVRALHGMTERTHATRLFSFPRSRRERERESSAALAISVSLQWLTLIHEPGAREAAAVLAAAADLLRRYRRSSLCAT